MENEIDANDEDGCVDDICFFMDSLQEQIDIMRHEINNRIIEYDFLNITKEFSRARKAATGFLQKIRLLSHQIKKLNEII